MHAEEIAEDFPVVTIDSNALEAARMLAEHRLPGIVVTDAAGKPYAVLPQTPIESTFATARYRTRLIRGPGPFMRETRWRSS